MRFIKLLPAILLVSIITSCTITEKMVLNEKGSGKFSYEIDGSQMMSMLGGAMKSESNNDSKDGKTNKKKKDIDSTFTFKQIFDAKKDSIAKLSPEEQEKIKKMERFSVHMVMNEEKGIMNYSMFTDFNSIAELQDVMSPVESMKSLAPGGKDKMKAVDSGLPENDSSMKFFYDGKTFKKIVAKKESKKEVAKDDAKDDSEAEKIKQSLEMIYGESNFKVVYQFPKAVKSVSIPNTLFSDDRKTVTIEYPLKDYMENPDKLNFEVQFK